MGNPKRMLNDKAWEIVEAEWSFLGFWLFSIKSRGFEVINLWDCSKFDWKVFLGVKVNGYWLVVNSRFCGLRSVGLFFHKFDFWWWGRKWWILLMLGIVLRVCLVQNKSKPLYGGTLGVQTPGSQRSRVGRSHGCTCQCWHSWQSILITGAQKQVHWLWN